MNKTPAASSGKPASILFLLLSVGETDTPYNKQCLPWADKLDINLCSFFKPKVKPPSSLTVFAGNNTLSGFYRQFRQALAAKDYDIIHAHAPHFSLMLLPWLLLGYRRVWRKTVFTVHSSYGNYSWRNKLMTLLVLLLARRIVCCGQASYDSIPRWAARLAGRRLCSVANGVNLARIDQAIAEAPPTTDPRPFTVSLVGRLIAIKNVPTLLQAFRRLANPDIRLQIIGTGELREPLQREARSLGIADQVIFTGVISRDQVYQRLAASDLFVLPSWGEGLPVATMEAMACRCPVVLSDIPPHREIAADDDDMVLFDPADPEALARAIARFVAMPAGQRQSIGERCRQRIASRFSLTAMHRGYLQVYEQVSVRQPRLAEHLFGSQS